MRTLTSTNPQGRHWQMATVAALLVVTFGLLLAESQRRHYATVRQYEALCTIGFVALDYLRDRGTPPISVEALVNAEFLYLDASTGMMRTDPPGRYKSVFANEAYRIRLAFPMTAQGYELVDGEVVSRDERSPVTLVSCDRLSDELHEYANNLIAEEWLDLMEAIENRSTRP